MISPGPRRDRDVPLSTRGEFGPGLRCEREGLPPGDHYLDPGPYRNEAEMEQIEDLAQILVGLVIAISIRLCTMRVL